MTAEDINKSLLSLRVPQNVKIVKATRANIPGGFKQLYVSLEVTEDEHKKIMNSVKSSDDFQHYVIAALYPHFIEWCGLKLGDAQMDSIYASTNYLNDSDAVERNDYIVFMKPEGGKYKVYIYHREK